MSIARRFSRRSILGAAAVAATASLALTGCVAGEDSEASAAEGTGDGVLNIDFATYNPLSLIIKEKGWLEASLADDGVEVNWLQSAGSNKANEALRSGAVDVGSTAGSAALLARANGSPIKTISLYSQPEWAALVTLPDSGIDSVEDLKGKSVAATKGTDPYFFLLQSLEEAGLSADDVTVENLQHADGLTALKNGSVDAWSGLDPIMAGAETERRRAVLPEPGLQHLRLPERHRVLPGGRAGARPGRGERLREGPRLGRRKPGGNRPDPRRRRRPGP